MKALDLGVKNMLFVDQFWCVLTRDWSQRTPILQAFFLIESSYEYPEGLFSLFSKAKMLKYTENAKKCKK